MQKLISDSMFRAEDTACCPWRLCCCSRSCAHRPPACVCTSPTTASLSFATTTWQSGSGAMATCPFIPRQTTGHPSYNPRSTSPLPPPILAERKGLLHLQTTASWDGRSSRGRYSKARDSGEAGWPCPWTSPPTSWTSCLTWPRQKTCVQRRLKTRACWRNLAGESDHITQFIVNSHDRCWPLCPSFLILFIINAVIVFVCGGEFSFQLTLCVKTFLLWRKSMQTLWINTGFLNTLLKINKCWNPWLIIVFELRIHILIILNNYCVRMRMFSVETVEIISEFGSKLPSDVQWRV